MQETKKLIPKLRFPEFSDERKSSKLSKFVIKHNAGIYKNKSLYGEGCNIVGVGDMYTINSVDGQVFRKVPLDKEELDKFTLDEGDLLYGESSLVRSGIGRTLYVTKKGAGTAFARHTRRYSVKDKINPQYLYYYLFTPISRRRLVSVATTTALTGITTDDYFSTLIEYPSPPEQQKIATFLSAIDEKVDLLTKQKELREIYKKGVMQKIFSREIRFKDENGNEFPEWEKKKLGDICNITTGKLDANAMVEGGKYRFYTCAKDYYKIDHYAFDTNALIISGNGANVGYIHQYQGKFNAYQRTYVLDGFEDDILFIKYYLVKSLSQRIFKEKKEGNTPYIVMSTLSDMPIYLPSRIEQNKISIYLNKIYEKIEQIDLEIQQAIQRKKGLLQQMFV